MRPSIPLEPRRHDTSVPGPETLQTRVMVVPMSSAPVTMTAELHGDKEALQSSAWSYISPGPAVWYSHNQVLSIAHIGPANLGSCN